MASHAGYSSMNQDFGVPVADRGGYMQINGGDIRVEAQDVIDDINL